MIDIYLRASSMLNQSIGKKYFNTAYRYSWLAADQLRCLGRKHIALTRKRSFFYFERDNCVRNRYISLADSLLKTMAGALKRHLS